MSVHSIDGLRFGLRCIFRLLFDEPIPANLLRAVSRMRRYATHTLQRGINRICIVAFSWRKLNVWTINWNRLILLYGPPGTGKTSLWYVRYESRRTTSEMAK